MPEKLTLENLHGVIEYHAPSTAALQNIANVRLGAENLCRAILQNCPDCADRSAALRHVREAMMTANASIVLEGKI